VVTPVIFTWLRENELRKAEQLSELALARAKHT
jgi:hypothetical protein